MELRDGRDKICISFTTPHQSGSLHEVLTIFVHGLNLVRLESRPIPERSWEYMFFVEFTGTLTESGMEGVMHELTQSTEDLRVFGNFKSNLD
jgi:chorismate mutase/prephenate dehydratase